MESKLPSFLWETFTPNSSEHTATQKGALCVAGSTEVGFTDSLCGLDGCPTSTTGRGETQAPVWWIQVCPCPPTLPPLTAILQGMLISGRGGKWEGGHGAWASEGDGDVTAGGRKTGLLEGKSRKWVRGNQAKWNEDFMEQFWSEMNTRGHIHNLTSSRQPSDTHTEACLLLQIHTHWLNSGSWLMIKDAFLSRLCCITR